MHYACTCVRSDGSVTVLDIVDNLSYLWAFTKACASLQRIRESELFNRNNQSSIYILHAWDVCTCAWHACNVCVAAGVFQCLHVMHRGRDAHHLPCVDKHITSVHHRRCLFVYIHIHMHIHIYIYIHIYVTALHLSHLHLQKTTFRSFLIKQI